MRYLDLLQRAQAYAAAILPEPALLAPQTPAAFVAWCEEQAAGIGETLGDLSAADLEEAGGLDAWRALVVRCVSELAASEPAADEPPLAPCGARHVGYCADCWALPTEEVSK